MLVILSAEPSNLNSFSVVRSLHSSAGSDVNWEPPLIIIVSSWDKVKVLAVPAATNVVTDAGIIIFFRFGELQKRVAPIVFNCELSEKLISSNSFILRKAYIPMEVTASGTSIFFKYLTSIKADAEIVSVVPSISYSSPGRAAGYLIILVLLPL